jgi:outer membrane immunogenic protein
VFSAAVAALFATPAMAADLPVKAPIAPVVAPINWTGLYLGIDGGWGNAHYDHSFNISGHYNLAAGDTFDYSKSGGLLGGHLGYNWQVGQWVLGLEGGITKSWLDSSDKISPFFPASDRWTSKVSWIAAVTPRVGVAFGNVLVYGKGGVAFAHLSDYVHDFADFVDFSTTRTGWTLGGGVEYMVVPNWIVGLEYNHFDFGSANVNMASTNFAGGTFYPGTNHDFKVTADALQARLSYKFGSLWP